MEEESFFADVPEPVESSHDHEHQEESHPFIDESAFEEPAHASTFPEPAPETARIPVRTPAAKELADAARPSKEQPAAAPSTLASVVARSVTLQTESAPPQDDMLSFDSPQPVSTIHATTIVARKQPAAADSQQTFSLGEEDRGRFKDTEPSIVQGEDLDVPTWMRLKKKLRR